MPNKENSRDLKEQDVKHIKKIKAQNDAGLSAKQKADPRLIKDLRPCIPVDGN